MNFSVKLIGKPCKPSPRKQAETPPPVSPVTDEELRFYLRIVELTALQTSHALAALEALKVDPHSAIVQNEIEGFRMAQQISRIYAEGGFDKLRSLIEPAVIRETVEIASKHIMPFFTMTDIVNTVMK